MLGTSPARSAARGVSTMTPNLWSNSAFSSLLTAAATASIRVLTQLDLAFGRHQRDHHLGHDGSAPAVGLDRRLEDGAGLHLIDFGHRHAQPDAAHPKHRVDLRQRLDPACHFRQGPVQRLGQLAHPLAVMRQEFVQRRVEQADADRQTRHDVEKRDEVGALHGKSRSSATFRSLTVSAKIISRITVRRSSSKNICSVRHRPMPSASNIRVVRASSGVSALARTLDVADIVGPMQQRAEPDIQRRFQHLCRARQHFAIGAVHGDHIAFAEKLAGGRG